MQKILMSQSDQALIYPKAELCLAQNYQLLSATVIVDTWLCQSRQSLPLVPAAAAAEAIGLTRSGGGAEATSGLNMVGLGICPNPFALSSAVRSPSGTKQAAPHPLPQSLQSSTEANSIPTARRRECLLVEGGELCTTRSQCSEALPASTGLRGTPGPHCSSTTRWVLQSTTPRRWLPG